MKGSISYTLSDDSFSAINAALTEVSSEMPFMVALEPLERKRLFKLGSRSVDFVKDCHDVVVAFPGILPSSFSVAEFNKDYALFEKLTKIKLLVDSLKEKVDNTYMAVGSEAMMSACEVYTYVQAAVPNTPGLESVADKLKERFKRQSKKKKPDSEQNPEGGE
jgi:hypothetical protein